MAMPAINIKDYNLQLVYGNYPKKIDSQILKGRIGIDKDERMVIILSETKKKGAAFVASGCYTNSITSDSTVGKTDDYVQLKLDNEDVTLWMKRNSFHRTGAEKFKISEDPAKDMDTVLTCINNVVAKLQGSDKEANDPSIPLSEKATLQEKTEILIRQILMDTAMSWELHKDIQISAMAAEKKSETDSQDKNVEKSDIFASPKESIV